MVDSTKTSPLFIWFVESFVLMMVAAWGRSFLLSDDFWFDEIRSLEFARGSPDDILFRFHSDNNHKLNTLCLWLLGERDHLPIYRYPSFVAGLLTIPVVVAIAQRHGDKGYAANQFTFSFVMAVYSTEARGYAMLVLFSLLSFAFFREYLRVRHWQWLPLFWLTSILGFLAHVSFVYAYIGFVIWSKRRFRSENRGSRFEIQQSLRCHALPSAFFGVLYWFDIRKADYAGSVANHSSVLDLFATTLGMPRDWFVVVPALFVIGALIYWEFQSERAEESDEWAFYCAVIFAAPLLFLIPRNPAALSVPNFLVCIAFFLIAFGRALQRLETRGRWSKELATLVAFAVIGGNLLWSLNFIVGGGRGLYANDLRRIANDRDRNEPVKQITVSSDHDVRNGKLVDFYSKHLHVPNLQYFPADKLPLRGTDWRITHTVDPTFKPPNEIKDSNGNRYELASQGRVPRRATISGWAWFLYRRDLIEKYRQEKRDRGEPF